MLHWTKQVGYLVAGAEFWGLVLKRGVQARIKLQLGRRVREGKLTGDPPWRRVSVDTREQIPGKNGSCTGTREECSVLAAMDRS